MNDRLSSPSNPPALRRALEALNALVGRAGVFVLVAALFIIGCLVSKDFLTPLNLTTTLKLVTLLGIVAVGVSFITYSGHYIDLSIPLIMALSGIVSISLLRYGIAVSLLCGVGAGLAVGVVNGWVIGYLRLNPIIWTLAMAAALDGLIRWTYSGEQLYADANTPAGEIFLAFYSHRLFGGVPLIVLILLALVVAGQLLLKHSGYGAGLKLTGASYEVARLSGVPVRRTVALAFVISSFTSAIGGILLTSLNKLGAVYIGEGYDFKVITAVVIGGVTLAGGRGGVIGAIGGVLAIGLLGNILDLQGVDRFEQDVIQGAVFILVVGLQSFARRRAGVEDE